MSAFDVQVGGDHYRRFPMQPTFFLAQNHWDFAAGNILKYVLRHDQKDGAKCLAKALHYVDIRHEAHRPITANKLGELLIWATLRWGGTYKAQAIPMREFIKRNDIRDADLVPLLYVLESWVDDMVHDLDKIEELKRRIGWMQQRYGKES